MSAKSPKLSTATSSCSLFWILLGKQTPSLIYLPFCWIPTTYRPLILYFTITILHNHFKGKSLHGYVHMWTPQHARPPKPCIILWKFLSLDHISCWRGPHSWHAVSAQEDTAEEAHTGPGLGGQVAFGVCLYRALARSWAQAVGVRGPLSSQNLHPLRRGTARWGPE